MNESVFSSVTSFIALVLYSSSYFFKTKQGYLITQGLGNVSLALSYLFIGEFFTMFTVGLGIARAAICYYYEKKNKNVPVLVIAALCATIIASFFVINFGILKTGEFWDALYLVASCLYAVVFTIRNLKVMRYVILVPHSLAIAYNLIIRAPFTSALSYLIELTVTLVAIVKFHLQERAALKEK